MTQPYLAIFFMAVIADSGMCQAGWHRRFPSLQPPVRRSAMTAFDESRGSTVMLFGQANSIALNDAWEWDGVNWTQVSAPLPPPRNGGALAWDAGRLRLVLFGGSQPGIGYRQDTWEWDGFQWAARTPAASPSARAGAGMAYDRARGVLLLFGGYDSNTIKNDTWEWNGTQWLQMSPGTSPSRGGVMAFDPVGNGILLYGGAADETWFWNGMTWQFRIPTTPPYVRGVPGMVTDLHRARVVLYGGNSTDAATWEWDGSQWHSMALPGPGPRRNQMMAYDSARRETVFFGGDIDGGSQVNDTWVYRTDQLATVASFGSGCAGSGGVPFLTNAPFQFPWIGSTAGMVAGNLAAGTSAVILASGTTASPPINLTGYGMPGCSALVLPMTAEFAAASAGTATWNMFIPNSMALVGVQFSQQAFAFEPGANSAGVIVTNGADLLIGVR